MLFFKNLYAIQEDAHRKKTTAGKGQKYMLVNFIHFQKYKKKKITLENVHQQSRKKETEKLLKGNVYIMSSYCCFTGPEIK